MGWWVRSPDLEPGEHVAWSRFANREQTSMRQTGGRLFLTDRRVLFQPNRLDLLMGGQSWQAGRNDIRLMRVEGSRPTAPIMGLTARNRRRLRVELVTGAVELFVINKVEASLGEMRQLGIAAD
jgi:hypothetical protein